MGLKGLAILAVLLAIPQTPAAVLANTNNPPSANRQAPPSLAADTQVAAPTSGTGGEGGAHEYPQPHIRVADPPPTAPVWTLHERITWGANLVLVFLGYAGILLVVQLLRKIDRQTGYAEAAAEAAAASAHAALLNAQAVIHAERPWILITVEPSRSMENSFTVVATNRGRTPARIVATAERTKIAVDEKHLPKTPEYRNEKPGAPVVPIILVPGESAVIKPFCRDDVKALCDSEERFKRIETWEEKVFLYGKVLYKDLISPPDDQAHETNWCCWYIHGRQNSGLVIAGPLEYNSHT
ncbi:MAG: hypothetical protein ABSC48_17770 [Terracidiphilus sp.]|jgi:hypothetical protein